MSIEHSIETLSGSMFDFDAPHHSTVTVEDIARALGNTCRFGGHVTQYYSVAEHACLVYRLVRDAGFPPDVCYAALHHDSHEAYLGDVPTPLKRKLGDTWRLMAEAVDKAIAQALGLNLWHLHHDAVKAADAQALGYEAAVLKPSGTAQRAPGWVKTPLDEVPPAAVCGLPAEWAASWFLYTHRKAKEALNA